MERLTGNALFTGQIRAGPASHGLQHFLERLTTGCQAVLHPRGCFAVGPSQDHPAGFELTEAFGERSGTGVADICQELRKAPAIVLTQTLENNESFAIIHIAAHPVYWAGLYS